MTYFLISIIVCISYLFIIMPSLKEKTEVSSLKKWDYAHRGLHDNTTNAPENSIDAFILAVDNNYGIELDVRLTKDKQVIVFHDDDLNRMCNIDDLVSNYTYLELQQFSLLQSNQKIPLFQDVLKLINGQTPIIVEIKMKGKDDYLCKKVNKLLSDYDGLYCIESFHPYALYWYRKNNPTVIRGQLVCHVKDSNMFFRIGYEGLLSNVFTRPDFIAFNYDEKDNLSKLICKKLFSVFSVTWTVQKKEDYLKAKESFDAIIFEGFNPNGIGKKLKTE